MNNSIEPTARRLYVIVREDLPPGLRAAQAGHAIAEFCLKNPVVASEWNENGNVLIILGVLNEWELLRVSFPISELMPMVEFCEPDLDDALTAVAAFPNQQEIYLFESFELAYSAPWWKRWARKIQW